MPTTPKSEKWLIKILEVCKALILVTLWFCPVVSEPVKPYFTRFLRVLTFCLEASKIVILKENGVVNGVVKLALDDGKWEK